MAKKKAAPKKKKEPVKKDLRNVQAPWTTPGYTCQCQYCFRYGPPSLIDEHEAGCKNRTKKEREEWPGDRPTPHPDAGLPNRNEGGVGSGSSSNTGSTETEAGRIKEPTRVGGDDTNVQNQGPSVELTDDIRDEIVKLYGVEE